MTEYDGLPTAPIFVIDIDVRSVFFSCSYVWHDVFCFLNELYLLLLFGRDAMSSAASNLATVIVG